MSNDVHLAKVSKIQRRRKDIHADENISPRADLSPDQTHSDNNISSCSTLDIGNLTQQQLETQIRDLSKRLQKSEDDRNSIEHQLKECSAEKDVCLRRLEVVSTAHECRITEMHCVIAELSKKLRAKQDNVIMEEQEPDGSEASYQDGSIYNSELNLTNPDAECQTDPLDSAGEEIVGFSEHNQMDFFDIELSGQDVKLHENSSKGQIEALQEEVLHLKAQIALLQSEIANSGQHNKILLSQQIETGKHMNTVEGFNADEEDDDVDANDSNCSSEHLLFVQSDKMPASQQHNNIAMITDHQENMRVPKMAERVKLRCVSNNDFSTNTTRANLSGKEIVNVEMFAPDLKEDNSCMLNSLIEPTQFDNEFQGLQRKVEQLKMQNAVLTLTMDECKEHCEHLYLLCGKYESNAIALQLALNCSDRAIEAYDVMLALLESKLALIKERSPATEESRKAVESVARHLLDRLECEKNLCENSLGPWQSTFNIPEKVYTPWTADDDNRLRYHVSKLKGCRSTAQNTIVNLESPFSDYYEKLRISAFENGSEQKNQERVAHLDLEMAVIMQELLSLREENMLYKTKMEDSLKERQVTISRISILEGALNQLQLQLSAVGPNSVLFQHQRDSTCGALENRVSYSEAEHTALIEQQLVEALTRETELKGRIQTLIASVAATQKACDTRFEEQFQNKSRELDSNLNMAQALEQNKRKYQTRIRKLEQKLSELSVNPTTACSIKPLLQQHDSVPETTL